MQLKAGGVAFLRDSSALRTSARASSLASALTCSRVSARACDLDRARRRRSRYNPTRTAMRTVVAAAMLRSIRPSVTMVHASGDEGTGGGGDGGGKSGEGGGGLGDTKSANEADADGRPRIVRPAPPLTPENQLLCMVATGVVSIVWAADLASTAFDMINVASTLILADETWSVTSSASWNVFSSAARKPWVSNEATSPSTRNVLVTISL